ncbi:MAG: DUF1295 domain-containing protein [Microscillaceae bacterium]
MSDLNTKQKAATSLGMAFTWVFLAYALAIGAGLLTEWALREQDILWRFFVADSVATVVIFIFSFLFKNSSFYDPYWSVIPIVLAVGFIYFAVPEADALRQGVVLALVAAWGLRLTYNWARSWQGLHHEDWRYVDFQQKTGSWYWLVSFSGIHYFPTVMVFLGCLPLLSALTQNTLPFGWIDALAALVTALAIAIEGIADNQLRRFRLSNPPKGAILNTGLWAYSRHPNYFGEMLFWWGIFFFALAEGTHTWWTGVGTLSITLLFIFYSVPALDARSKARRPEFAAHCRRVSAVIPWFPKKS